VRFESSLRGFTLIEVMLAMTLLSIMMVLLFSALRISAQSWDAGEGKIAQVNETALVYNFFQRHLVTARPLWNDYMESKQTFSFQSTPRSFSFQGTSSSLKFVSAFPASAARPGLQLFMIESVQQQGKEDAVKVTISPFFPAVEGEEWEPEEEILLNNVRSFQLAYFGPDENSGTDLWQDQWLDRNTLPGLVKIKIERSNEVFWPEMLIALKMAELPKGQAQRQEKPFE